MRPSEERASGTADFIVFCRFEQHFIVLCVYLRIVGSAECIVFLLGLSGIESSYASIRGLLGVGADLIVLRGFEQH